MLLPHCGLLGVSIKSWESGKILPYPHSSPWTLCLCSQAGSGFFFFLDCFARGSTCTSEARALPLEWHSHPPKFSVESPIVLPQRAYKSAGNGCVWSDTWPHTISLAEPWVEGWPLLARANNASSQLLHLKAEVEECEGMDIYTLGIILLCPHTSSLKITPVTPQSQAAAGTPVFLSQSLRRASSKAR